MDETQRQLGNIVIDFVNNTNRDETFHNLMISFNEAFDLSSGFFMKWRNLFPFRKIQQFLPLTKIERDLCVTLIKIEILKKRKKTKKGKLFLPLLDEKLHELEKPLEHVRITPFRKKRVKEIKLIAEYSYRMEPSLKVTDGYREAFKNFLNHIIDGKNIYEHKWFRKKFERAARPTKNMVIRQDGSIVQRPIFDKLEYPSPNPKKYLEYILSMLLYSIGEFLMNTKNIKHIYKCRECGKFGISATAKGKVYCSDKCKNKYHNRNNIESGYMRRKKRERHALGLDQ
jgi:hypothetical protein